MRSEWPGGSMSTNTSLLRVASQTTSASQQARRMELIRFLIDFFIRGVRGFCQKVARRLWRQPGTTRAIRVLRALLGARYPAGASR